MPKARERQASYQAQPAVQSTGLADALFTATQKRVLGVLFGQPDRSFYGNELIGLARGGSGAVQRELSRLVQSGLVTVRASGNQKHYQANPNAPIFGELRAIVRKTVALADPLREALAPFAASMRFAFVFGSMAKGEDSAQSDVDLLVVSDVIGYPELFEALEAASLSLGRPVNPTIYTETEFAKRLKRADSFVRKILDQPRIWLVGAEDDLVAR